MKYKAVLLDFDGTIADTTQLIVDSWQHTYQTLLGRDGDLAFILSTFGETLRNALREAFPDHDVEEAVEVYRNYQMELQQEAWYLFPEVESMLQDLKARGYLVGIVTSRTKSTCLQGLSSCGIDKYIDALVTCDDTTAHKPDPEPALIGLKALGVAPEEALCVGDTRFDIDCAHNAGVDAALVAWSATMKLSDAAPGHEPEYYIQTPAHLIEIMEGRKRA